MAWIKVEQSLWTHRKTMVLAGLLSIDDTHAGGIMARLWSWALDNVPSGDLTGMPPVLIAKAAGWSREHTMFVQALISAGFIDQDGERLTLHGWDEYVGQLVARRESNAARQKRFREASRVTLPVSNALHNSYVTGQSRVEQSRVEQTKEKELPASSPAMLPDWAEPLRELPGFKNRNHEKAMAAIEAQIADAGAQRELVMAKFADTYSTSRHRYGWSDPVATMRQPRVLAIAIKDTLGQRPMGAPPSSRDLLSREEIERQNREFVEKKRRMAGEA